MTEVKSDPQEYRQQSYFESVPPLSKPPVMPPDLGEQPESQVLELDPSEALRLADYLTLLGLKSRWNRIIKMDKRDRPSGYETISAERVNDVEFTDQSGNLVRTHLSLNDIDLDLERRSRENFAKNQERLEELGEQLDGNSNAGVNDPYSINQRDEIEKHLRHMQSTKEASKHR